MTINTVTKPYQGRTYLATLTTGRQVVITVEAGYADGGGGEIARLQSLAQERYGFPVAGCNIFDPLTTSAPEDRGTERWWSVAMRTLTPVADVLPDGSYDCYGMEEYYPDIVRAECPGLIPVVMEKRAPSWNCAEFFPINGPTQWDEVPW